MKPVLPCIVPRYGRSQENGMFSESFCGNFRFYTKPTQKRNTGARDNRNGGGEMTNKAFACV